MTTSTNPKSRERIRGRAVAHASNVLRLSVRSCGCPSAVPTYRSTALSVVEARTVLGCVE